MNLPSDQSEGVTPRDVYSVSRLNREVRTVLEGSFPLIWVEGEISNLARPGSGHWYFSLKDEAAQVRCAMFRNRNALLRFRPDNGMQVLARARIGLYEARGEFQLIIEHMEEAGDGALRRAFEALKQRLDAEGLFTAAHKQALPPHPACLGVVTSPTGAAIHDILTTLRRRYPALPVIVYPVPVQGAGAADQIAAAIRTAAARKECDVLIVARGGGSLEDLWAFNEESVARAIHECTIPVVSGIGHEVDFTIADFVADQRAATPTAAAELVSPDGNELRQGMVRLFDRLQRALTQHLAQRRQGLAWLEKRVQHPGRRLQQIAQRLDDLELRMRNAQRNRHRHVRTHLETVHERLQRYSPTHRVARTAAHCDELGRRLQSAVTRYVKDRNAQLATYGRALDAVSPLATLGRGYAIVTDSRSGEILRSAAGLKQGDLVEARLHEGRLLCRVDEVK